MSNAWFFYVFPLGVAMAFAIAGAVLVRKAVRGDRDAQGHRYGPSAGCFGILVGGVGSTLALAILLTAPTPWQRQQIFDYVFRTPPQRIEQFVIQPGRADQYRPLTESPVLIEDPARVRRIADILRTSVEVWPNHPRARWTATVEMVTRDGTYHFSVHAPVPGDANGTLVTALRTKEGAGWNLGDVRADGLDQVLEDAVHATGRHGVKKVEEPGVGPDRGAR